jgi:hypothetical protein
MIILLRVLSAVLMAGGAVAVAYGQTIHEFSVGQGLLVAGGLALVAGFLGLAIAVLAGELREVSTTLRAGMGARLPSLTEGPAVAPAPRPTRPQPAAEPAQAEADEAAPEPQPSAPPPQPPPRRDRPRPNVFAVARGAGAPLLPTEVPARPRADPPGARPPPPEAEPAPSAEIAPEPRGKPNLFDSVWPTRARPESEPATPPRERLEPSLGGTPPVSAPQAAPPSSPRRSETAKPTILKSGVIDGMAYTLYTDGAIEAQLPQGLVRFASIDELRAHLEQGEE